MKAIEAFTNVDEFKKYLMEECKNSMQHAIDYTKCYCEKPTPVIPTSTSVRTEAYIASDLKIYVPGKVIGIKIGSPFKDDLKEIKMVCRDGDHFDLRYGIAIGIAKYLYGKEMTVEGIEAKAKELLYLKNTNKIIDWLIKDYENRLKEKEKEEARLAEIEEIKKRRRKKNKKKAERRRRKQILLRLSEDGLFTSPPVEIPQPDIPPVQVICANRMMCDSLENKPNED